MIVSLVRFDSQLSDREVQVTFEERSDAYRRVPGLTEKLYVRFRETGEYGAVYVWESEADLIRFRETELARSIPSAYRIGGAPSVEIADLRLVVRPQPVSPERAAV